MISPLLTDLYQLTMAYGYWKLGMHEREAVFHQIFRKQPFEDGGYAVAAGLATVVEFLENWHFSAMDLAYLQTLNTPDGHPLLPREFLQYLGDLRFQCDIDAIPEGTVVFPHEPMLRVKGPLLQCQLIESTLLNIVNFQTLVATKAARVCHAARGDAVLEFGLRRAQGPDGALSASRAAYIGGCSATSNVLAGQRYGIPVSGTHSHSWVTAFSDERAAFSAWASVMPRNCILLVDTYDTLSGVKHAVETGKQLREAGFDLLGIRLDSGDMAELSIRARRLLDQAGFVKTKIIASNSLDEYVIREFREHQSAVTVWGVGTHLATAYDHPALDGVYKLSALCDRDGKWEYKLKVSEEAVKISNPGIHQVRRFFEKGVPVMDAIYDIQTGIADLHPKIVSLDASPVALRMDHFDQTLDLLQPVLRQGKAVSAPISIHAIREKAIQEVSQFLQSPHHTDYPVGIEHQLYQTKQNLIRDVTLKNKSE